MAIPRSWRPLGCSRDSAAPSPRRWRRTSILCQRRFVDVPEREAIRVLFAVQVTPQKVAGEVAYLARPSACGFERPYGWGWALKLQSELLLHQNADGKCWSQTMQPFADAFVQR